MIKNLLNYHLVHLCKTSTEFQMFFNNLHYTISISLSLSTSVLFISLIQLVNEAQFLNATPLFLSSACLADNNCAEFLGLSAYGFVPASQ